MAADVRTKLNATDVSGESLKSNESDGAVVSLEFGTGVETDLVVISDIDPHRGITFAFHGSCHCKLGMHTLITLPVELLYEIQLCATSSTLPQTCKTLHNIFSASPTFYRAQYLVACTNSTRLPEDVVFTKMLRYHVCTQDVLETYFRTQLQRSGESRSRTPPELPRRLFRVLGDSSTERGKARAGTSKGWTDRDPPLPFLRYLYYDACARHLSVRPNANSHDGYALTKAVQVGFVPLVRFLLDSGASPALKGCLPVIIAIHHRDLSMVRMLLERTDAGESSSNSTAKGKRRKLEDRVEVTAEMLKAAVKCKAQDIVEYLTREKGCIPDMQTLLLMR